MFEVKIVPLKLRRGIYMLGAYDLFFTYQTPLLLTFNVSHLVLFKKKQALAVPRIIRALKREQHSSSFNLQIQKPARLLKVLWFMKIDIF